jgi:GDP-L-fucose synthase
MNARMLEAFHSEGVERAVFIGSATLYQDFEGFIKEDELDLNQDPHSSYLGIGWVARYLEKLCRFWHEQAGMEFVLVRAANIFGPFAKFDPAVSNFIPAIIRKAVDGMDPFEVWGSPDVIRDVIYSGDFAEAVVTMLDSDAVKFDVFNVGSGVKTTVGEVVEWALKHAGFKPSEIIYNTNKPTTIKFRALDCSKVRDVFGWQPEHTIEEGIRKTAAWWRENKNRWEK